MPKRRGRGEGSIFRRKSDGLWVGQIETGVDDAGNRIRKTVYGSTKKEVQDELMKLQQGRAAGDLLADVPLRQFIDQWLPSIKAKVEARTWERYEQHCRLHLKKLIGHYKVKQLTGLHVTQMYQRMAEDGDSASCQRRVGKCLRQIMASAVRWRLIQFNPAKEAPLPRANKAEIRPLDVEQVTKFLDAVKNDRHFALYVTAIDTGMREGELWALGWSDIDLEAGVISVTKSLAEVKSAMVLKQPKSRGGRRSVRISQSTVEVLKAHRAKMEAEGLTTAPTVGAKAQGLTGAPVFCGPTGGYLRRRNFHRDSFQPAIRRANELIEKEAKARGVEPVLLPRFRFHDLRHTCATLLLLLDENPKVVAERLGHSKINLTLDTYSHIVPSLQKRAADKIGQVLGDILNKQSSDLATVRLQKPENEEPEGKRREP